MEGVTTALVVFILVCVVVPDLVKHRPQFYAGLGCVVAVILLDAAARLFRATDEIANQFTIFAYVAVAALNVVGLILLFLSCGGITARGLAADVKGAIEVIRRGETSKEVLIPIGGQKAGRRHRDVSPAEERQAHDLSADAAGGEYVARKPVAPPPPPAKQDDGPIPVE